MKFTDIQNRFTQGEIGKNLQLLSDQKEYKNSVSWMENFIPMIGGGVRYRPAFMWKKTLEPITLLQSPTGEGHVIADLDATETPIGFPFVVSKAEKYIVTIRPTIAIRADGYDTDQAIIEIYREYLGSFSKCSCNIDRLISHTKATYGGGTSVGDVTTRTLNLIDKDVSKFQFCQFGDYLVICTDGTYAPIVIARTSKTLHTFEVFMLDEPETFEGAGSAVGLITAFQVHPALRFPVGFWNIDTNVTLTSSSATNGGNTNITCTGELFDSTWIGKIIHIESSDLKLTAVVRITSITSELIAVGVNLVTGHASGSASWRVSTWNADDGFPTTVTSYQQRMVLGGPGNRFYNSRTGNIFHFLQTKLAQDVTTDVSKVSYYGAENSSDAFDTAPAYDTSPISWMNSDKNMIVGTEGAEYIITTVDGEYSALSPNCQRQTNHGSTGVNSCGVGYKTFFVSLDGKRIKEVGYSNDDDTYIVRDLSNINEDIVYHGKDVDNSFKSVVFKQLRWDEINHVLWALTNEGKVIGLAYDLMSETLAWFRITIGGTSTVKSLWVMPDEDGIGSSLWACVERLDGSLNKVMTIEQLQHDYRGETIGADNDEEYMLYLDGCRRSTDGEERILEDGTTRFLEDGTPRYSEL
jgi:hypothetical protein